MPLGRLRSLLVNTIKDARDDRIVGVAAEVAFFALLAIPPALVVVAGIAGYVAEILGPDVRENVRHWITNALGGFLAPETMGEFVAPAVEALFREGRGGIISIGAVVAVWSASRLIRVLIEALNVAYDVEEWRPSAQRRLLAVGLTFGGLLSMATFMPVLVAGPRLGVAIDRRLHLGGLFADAWTILHWPVVAGLGVAILATLYHVAPNWRTPWRRDVPGAVLAAVLWVVSAIALRVYVRYAFSESDFGPLAAPVVLLLWLYATAMAILLGGELNAEIEKMWPAPEAGPKSGGRAARIQSRTMALAERGMGRVSTRLGRRRNPA